MVCATGATERAHLGSLLAEARHGELRDALADPGGHVAPAPAVALGMRPGERVGRSVCRHTGWRYLRRVGARWRKPRPRLVRADPAAQADFKVRLRPLLRQVATAFPDASVQLWAVDEHRVGLRPILLMAWTLDGGRPLAPVELRYDWRYVVGFVHPASSRAVFHLATGVSIALFEAELEAFAAAVGAGPDRQVVLVLDRAGWHASAQLRVPDPIHLLFLPPHSPELQPAAHLWPLTDTVLASRHLASLEELDDAQAVRCAALHRQPDLVSSATPFPWWPRHIRKRQGPRRHA